LILERSQETLEELRKNGNEGKLFVEKISNSLDNWTKVL
jgi:hypothetical protein